MPPEILLIDPESAALHAYSCFRSLICAAGGAHATEQGLGGNLLYVGELNQQGRAMAIAGNVAGCATLAATADTDVQKQAIRDGVIDFLVTSLDEALRILKNEIRKQSTVAVCIALPPDPVEQEMLERGVVPDILGSEHLREERQAAVSSVIVSWSVQSQPVRWLPRLDALALDCLQAADVWNRRWIQLSPRYLGRAASNQRILCSNHEFATNFAEHIRGALDRGDIAAAITVRVTSDAGTEEFQLHAATQPAS